jgi:hypothetical protein
MHQALHDAYGDIVACGQNDLVIAREEGEDWGGGGRRSFFFVHGG